ncbi:uncharacterized protein LOC118510291 isoform X3 [Anopheles stephensi]|uniref:uncharacterized protein LOC118510291 isoform X3 n=1 Tax=Anopheles stephensi TaxID=30069 RepID=UPI0016588BCB|nr:uncharacterized protein LOC118510291 isoform X3 [Anopheles stephensi]
MEELQFFNVFNHCFVSPIYLGFDPQIGRYVFRSRNDRWNVTLLTAIVTSASFSSVTLLMELLQNQLGSVLGATTIILYAMRLLVIAPLTLWTLFKKRKLMSACNFALNIVQDQQGWLSQQTGRRRKSLRMPTGQIATIAVTLFLGLAVQAMEMWKIERLRKFHYAFNICAFVFLEFITLMHVMLVQCWTRFTSQRIEDLLWVVKRNASSELLPMVICLWEALQRFKQHIASSFGIMNVLHALDAFVTSVVETYTVIYILELGYGIQAAFLNLTTLILYTGMYYTFASAHELLQFKEAELKDALKSMQYRQLQKQTRDQKDFYDLVNLKLMMASPKITACGLFEINLQIFYNVFAAIITYIVILFQFRGFEKTP